jgi:hypothetical protein
MKRLSVVVGIIGMIVPVVVLGQVQQPPAPAKTPLELQIEATQGLRDAYRAKEKDLTSAAEAAGGMASAQDRELATLKAQLPKPVPQPFHAPLK